MSYFYGPVPSRRLGFSLGVDLVPPKACSFDCVYCQLGRTSRHTVRRFSFVDTVRLKKEYRRILKKHPRIDYVTLAGSGEPTLHKGLDKIIAALRDVSGDRIPVAVITNSSLLYRREVRKEILGADLIVPSLDAVTPSLFRKINRPHPAVTVEKVIRGLAALRKEFKGLLWLEIMLVKGVNDTDRETAKFKEIIERIRPDKVQLNLPVRPAGGEAALPVSLKVKKIQKVLSGSAEVVSPFPARKQERKPDNIAASILEYVRRRPATLEDLSNALGMHPQELLKGISGLLDDGVIKTGRFKNSVFYFA